MSIRSKHRFWTQEYVVAVTKGRRTRFFYGQRLKDALAAAGKAAHGTVFSFAKFERQAVTVAELSADGRVLKTYA